MAELPVVSDSAAAPAATVVTFPDSPFKLHQPFPPAGDQPTAIDLLCEGIDDGLFFQTLLGVTGSGKTYTMANVIASMATDSIKCSTCGSSQDSPDICSLPAIFG